MLEKTQYSQGKKRFKNNTFSSQEWSAPTMVSPNEIESLIASMQLVGRTIKGLRIIGLSYFHTKDWIEEHAYNSLPEDMPEEKKQEYSNFDRISESLEFIRYVHIDEPFLIKFTDENTFEIDTPQAPGYRISMNCLPWDIQGSTNNIDVSILFAPVLNQKIIEVEITKKASILPLCFFALLTKITPHEKLLNELFYGSKTVLGFVLMVG